MAAGLNSTATADDSNRPQNAASKPIIAFRMRLIPVDRINLLMCGSVWLWLQLALVVAHEQLYSDKDLIVPLFTAGDWEEFVDSSAFLWVVQVYQPSCPYSVRLAPQYKQAAKRIVPLAHFAVIDRQKGQSLVEKLQIKYQVKVHGTPTIFSVGPKGNPRHMLKNVSLFQEQQTTNNLIKFTLGRLPSYIYPLTSENFNEFALTSSHPKVVVLPGPTQHSPLPVFKALASHFIEEVIFGVVEDAADDVALDIAPGTRPALLGLHYGSVVSVYRNESYAFSALSSWVTELTDIVRRHDHYHQEL